MSNSSDQNRQRALEAARDVFARYGFQRAGMADIAREAGVSRPALYVWFDNKAALFKALAEHLKDDALTGAREAWRDDADFTTNLEATILAKDLTFFRLLHASPHGAELMAVDATVTATIAAAMDAGFAAILAERAEILVERGVLDLRGFGDAGDFGRTVALLASGVKHEVRDEAGYRAGLRALCRLVAHATARL